MLCTLAKKFDIIFNIRGSTVTAEMGLVALEIDGSRAGVNNAAGWLRAKGVMVEPIEKNVIAKEFIARQPRLRAPGRRLHGEDRERE